MHRVSAEADREAAAEDRTAAEQEGVDDPG
jgi:hypothetical protein